MSIREQIVEEARTFMGTPFKHQGRAKNIGVDCVGLIVLPPKVTSIECGDYFRYSRQPNPRRFIEELSKHAERIEVEEALPSDIVVFWISREDIPQHFGLLAPSGRDDIRFNVIHTNATIGRVVECPLTSPLIERVHSYWKYRGLNSHD